METREGKHPWLQHIHAELYNHLTKLYRHTHRHTHMHTYKHVICAYTRTNTLRSLPGLVKENVAGLWILLHVWGDPVELFNLARINFLKSADKQTKSVTTSLTQFFLFYSHIPTFKCFVIINIYEYNTPEGDTNRLHRLPCTAWHPVNHEANVWAKQK